MKKLLSLMLTLILLLSLTAGCKNNKSVVTMVTIVYADYSILKDEEELLMVLVPTVTGENTSIVKVDGAVLPKAKAVDASGNTVDIKAGDLIVMNFNKGLYIRQETSPKMFIDEPDEVNVVCGGIKLGKGDGGYSLSLPNSLISSGSLQVGKTLNFFSSKDDITSAEKSFYSAVISDIDGDFFTVFIQDEKMQSVINSLYYGKLQVEN